MVDVRWCQLGDQFLNYTKMKIAVSRNPYGAFLPESAPRPIQVVALFLIMLNVVDPSKHHLFVGLSFANTSHMITS